MTFDPEPTLLADGDLVDVIAIERRLRGDRTVHLTTAERRHAARLLAAHGHGVGTIAHRLGISTTTAHNALREAA